MMQPSVDLDSSQKKLLEDDFIDIEAGYESGDIFLLKPLSEPGKLPDRYVAPFSLNEVGVYDTLKMLTADAGLALSIEGGARASENYGAVSMFGVEGKLQDVMDSLSESMGFFYSVRKGTLRIEPDRQFVNALPPALSDDNMAGLTNTLQFLGAREPYADRMSRSLVFRANRTSLAKIESYLSGIRNSRSMIIYAMNIFQVDLKHNSDTGIQWNKIGWAAAPGASISSGAGGGAVSEVADAGAQVAGAIGKAVTGIATALGLGMVLSASHFNVEMLVNFLKTQGRVKAISQPRIGVMNGTKGTLSVGQTLTYVAKVGTTFATSLNQITTETKDLKTGVDIAVSGDVSDNTVYTRLDLKISDLVKMNRQSVLGTDLALPQTVFRELNTVVRARPGDMFLVGGITIDKDSREDSSGASKNGVSTEVSRSEMVLALRTKVVNFLPKPKPPKVPSVSAVSLPMPPDEPSEQRTATRLVTSDQSPLPSGEPRIADAGKVSERPPALRAAKRKRQASPPATVHVPATPDRGTTASAIDDRPSASTNPAK